MREHCMSEFEFFDVYLNEKREENRLGLELLAERCQLIANIDEHDSRWYELFRGGVFINIDQYNGLFNHFYKKDYWRAMCTTMALRHLYKNNKPVLYTVLFKHLIRLMVWLTNINLFYVLK